MIRAFQLFIQDIKSGKNIENYFLIIASIIVAILSIMGNVGQDIIDSVTLAVLAVIIYREIENARSINQLKNGKSLPGIENFYEDRSNLPSLEDRLSGSKQEIAILGLLLGSLVHRYLQYLEERVRAGCKIKILMLSPVDKNGQELKWLEQVGQAYQFVGLPNMLEINILRIKQWLAQIDEQKIRSGIEVRLYPTLPTISAVFIDKNTTNGSIKVEHLIHDLPPANRPSYQINRNELPKLYDRLVSSFNKLWEISIDIQDVKIS